MPFAVHTMDPGCPVVAIEETAEAAAEAAERLGYDVGSARVLILPCAVTTDAAVRLLDKVNDMQQRLDLAEDRRDEAEKQAREAKKERDSVDSTRWAASDLRRIANDILDAARVIESPRPAAQETT